MASLANNLAAAIAFNRFGLGGRPNDVIPASPAAWLIGQLAGPDPYTGAGLPNTAAGLSLFYAFTSARNTASFSALQQQLNEMFMGEIGAFMTNALVTRVPFRERLVWFWSNHFALMGEFAQVSSCAGAFIREAIRPYVNGTFKDMLLAVMQHPAMLFNLNNNFSSGPDSLAAQRCGATGCTSNGINENLARECLELYTLGVGGGYTQADVDALAMLITGWSVQVINTPRGFKFNDRTHEPTPQTLMGHVYGPTQADGIAALTWLGTHPVTYKHLATKLVTHFVSDTPSASDIAAITAVLGSTGGNLAAAATAVVNLPSAWQPYTKFRAPIDYTVGVLRGLGVTSYTAQTANDPAYAAAQLGAPVWQPEFPNGYSDLAADWVGPAQMLVRSDWINVLCTQCWSMSPETIAGSTLGPLLRPSTLAAMNAASSVHDALSLLFLSPEYQRR